VLFCCCQDINDDIADFNEKQINSLEETKEFYFDKYPAVRARSVLGILTRGVL
jgi:N-acetyl-anhydromuramyl-L-alanine amidase AmpD